MRKIYAFILTGIICVCLSLVDSASASAQALTPRYITTGKNSNGFFEYLPAGYDSTKKYPLMVFLNGVGELGNGDSAQLRYVLKNGPGALCNAGTFPKSFTVNGQTFSFIVLMPQFITNPASGDLDTIINYGVAHYAVDTGRIYLTGLSEGGAAIWAYASDFSRASRLAAIFPIAGGPLWSGAGGATMMSYARLPIFSTANINDPVTPSSTTVQNIKTIDSVKPSIVPKALDTLFAGASHDAWTETYDPGLNLHNGMNAYQWMLQYSRDPGSTSTGPPDTTKPTPPDTTKPTPPVPPTPPTPPSPPVTPTPPVTTPPATPPSNPNPPATPPSGPTPPSTPAPPASTPAPLTLLSFEATLAASQPVANLSWSAMAGSAKDSFVVQWSKDGREFMALDTMAAQLDTTAGGKAYSFADTHVLMGLNYYRLCMMTQSDTPTFSEMQRVTYLPSVSGFHFGPNPATSMLYLTLQGASSSPLRVNIIDMSGRVIDTWVFQNQGSSTLTGSIDVGNLAKGSYMLEALTKESRSTQLFIKQ